MSTLNHNDLNQWQDPSETRSPTHMQVTNSNQDREQDVDWTSSSGSSSGLSSDDEDAQEVPEPSPYQKSDTTTQQPGQDENLRTRIASFLPRLRQANEQLKDESSLKSHQIDDVADNEEQFIEMNLGLGVLKEKKTKLDILVQDSSSDESDDEIEIPSSGEAAEHLPSKNTKIQEI